MKRLKTFGIYLLMFVGFYIFSTLLSAAFISTNYDNIKIVISKKENVEIEIEEAKATFVNGYIKGKITNNTNENIKTKYIKIEMISSRNNNILNKYIKIDDLKTGESKNFILNFRAENIKSSNIKVVDKIENEKNDINFINLSDAENEEVKGISILLSTVILLKYVFL